MKIMRLGTVIAVLLCTFCIAAQAEEQTPKPAAPMTANAGPGGQDFPVGKFAALVNYQYGDSDHIRHYSDELNSNSEVTKNVEVVKFRYGILPNWDIRSATPIYNLHIDNKYASDRTNYGVGDTTVLLHSVVLNQAQGDAFYLALDYGAVLPTGSTTSHSVNGIGSGAWGLTGGILGTYFLGSNRFDTEFNYATFGEGSKHFEKGDRFRWNASYAYALNNLWDLGVESNFEWNEETELHGVRQNDSSTEWYVGPKAVFKYQPWGLTVGVAGLAPAYRWYESTKSGSDDFRFEMKIIKSFDVGSFF